MSDGLDGTAEGPTGGLLHRWAFMAAALAERLAAIPSLPPQNENAVLPVQPVASAKILSHYLLDKAAAAGAKAWLGGDGIVDELGDGSAALRPAVHQLDSACAEQAEIELSFPSV